MIGLETTFITCRVQLRTQGTGDMQKGSERRQLSEGQLAALRTHRDRQERYLRTAHFVQSKWFMIIGSLAIAVFLLVIFLIA